MPSDREAAERAGFDGFLEKPINVRALPAQVASFMARPAVTEPLTILAVDDEPLNLRLLEAVLTPHGHTVVPAASGAGVPGRARARAASISCCSTS